MIEEFSSSGVLNDAHLLALIERGQITASQAVETRQVQPASLDLRLGTFAYRLRASFLPGATRHVADMLADPSLCLHRLDLTDGAVLETGCVYLVPLLEGLALSGGLAGRANPKSSTGRIDVFTRLVTDQATQFDEVRADYTGPLYLEVCPRTFPILARTGDKLAQLRLRSGTMQAVAEEIVNVNLLGDKDEIIGWRARRHAGLIDLANIGAHPARKYWDPLYAEEGRLILQPEEFYILASDSGVAIPADQAAEMAPMATELGEFRVHYAGFFDPGFGTGQGGGSRAVLEVRSRDVPFILEHGQPVARLVYEQMAARPTHIYGGQGNHYQGQGLKLSKHFG